MHGMIYFPKNFEWTIFMHGTNAENGGRGWLKGQEKIWEGVELIYTCVMAAVP